MLLPAQDPPNNWTPSFDFFHFFSQAFSQFIYWIICSWHLYGWIWMDVLCCVHLCLCVELAMSLLMIGCYSATVLQCYTGKDELEQEHANATPSTNSWVTPPPPHHHFIVCLPTTALHLQKTWSVFSRSPCSCLHINAAVNFCPVFCGFCRNSGGLATKPGGWGMLPPLVCATFSYTDKSGSPSFCDKVMWK